MLEHSRNNRGDGVEDEDPRPDMKPVSGFVKASWTCAARGNIVIIISYTVRHSLVAVPLLFLEGTLGTKPSMLDWDSRLFGQLPAASWPLPRAHCILE